MKLLLKSVTVLSLASALFPALSSAQHYNQKNLVSDVFQPPNSDGSPVVLDPNLKNPWGITRSSGGPWWISNNNSGTSTLYSINSSGNAVPASGFPDPPGSTFDNFVIVPPPGFTPGASATPTGIVFNGSPSDFILDKGTPPGNPAVFIFATEDGTISGWNPLVNIPAGGNPPSINVVLEVDNSGNGSPNGAVYKGATTADIKGVRYLYVTNFRAARVEVYDTNFHRVHFGEDASEDESGTNFHGAHFREDAFEDESIPKGFAPFNVQNIGGSLFVTYAKQDAAKHDDVAGDGNGFVDIYSPAGKLEGRLQHGPWMNSPWGVVWTPRDFGEFSNTILVGNFGSGWIAAFNGFTRKFIGFMQNPDNSLVTIHGLWSLTFGNCASAGPSTTLFFSAGINDESDGLFGTLTPVKAEQDGDEE